MAKNHRAYGIESYFVAEGTGNPTGKLAVQAVVTKSGRARIKEVFWVENHTQK